MNTNAKLLVGMCLMALNAYSAEKIENEITSGCTSSVAEQPECRPETTTSTHDNNDVFDSIFSSSIYEPDQKNQP